MDRFVSVVIGEIRGQNSGRVSVFISDVGIIRNFPDFCFAGLS
jgi:hypothetical protein